MYAKPAHYNIHEVSCDAVLPPLEEEWEGGEEGGRREGGGKEGEGSEEGRRGGGREEGRREEGRRGEGVRREGGGEGEWEGGEGGREE